MGERVTYEIFCELVDELNETSNGTMTQKGNNYAPGGDRLHNFHAGAEIMGCTPAQVCWGYMTKHLVALRDKVQRNDFSNREDVKEKCQDIINYIKILWCIANEESGDHDEN